MTATHVLEETSMATAFQAPSEVCSILRPAGTVKAVPTKTNLFQAGDPPQGVFLVLHGSVLVSAGDRHSRFSRIAHEGSLLGLPSTVSDRPYSLTAETLTEVEVCCIEPEKFRGMLASNPRLGIAVVNILSDEVSALRACQGALAPVHG